MEQKIKRTITEVMNYETGEYIEANAFFRKPLDEVTIYRSELQKAIERIRDPLFICYYCKQLIRIRGGINSPHKRKAEIFHFAHLKDSDECHIKTKNIYTKEEVDRIKYNGEKESILHQTLKLNIAESLRRNQETKQEISSIEVEKVIKDKVAKEWKKPDINAFFKDKHIAIEFQLSTTWLDVITRRQHFYKEQGIYMFWVFHSFNTNDDVRKLTFNDVIYTNNQNAYVFDKETYELSKSENDLILKCYYKTYSRIDETLYEDWEYSYIKLSDLTFNENEYKIFYHDTETQKRKVEEEIRDHISDVREVERLKIIKENELERKRKELENRIETLNDEIKKIEERKKEIKKKEYNTSQKLLKIKELFFNVNNYTDKILNYFSTNNYNKPFYGHDEFINLLSEEFESQIKTAASIISANKQDQITQNKSLLSIRNLPTIEIAEKKYSSINPSIDWNFIKRNYSLLQVIKKDLIEGLFAEDDINVIKSENELNRFHFSKDYFFLIDFTTKIAELNINIEKNKKVIEKKEVELKTIKEKIKEKLEIYVQKEIVSVETELKNYIDRQTELNNKENSLTSPRSA